MNAKTILKIVAVLFATLVMAWAVSAYIPPYIPQAPTLSTIESFDHFLKLHISPASDSNLVFEYSVYRSTDSNTGFLRIGCVEGYFGRALDNECQDYNSNISFFDLNGSSANLANGQQFHYFVRATDENRTESANSNVESNIAMPTPTNLRGDTNTVGKIHVYWNAPENIPLTGWTLYRYHVYRWTAESPNRDIAQPDVTEYFDSTVSSGVSYTYGVIAEYVQGNDSTFSGLQDNAQHFLTLTASRTVSTQSAAPAISISSPYTILHVHPNQEIAVPVTIENNSKQSFQVTLSTQTGNEELQATVGSTNFSLNSGEQTTLNVNFQALDLTSGDYNVSLFADYNNGTRSQNSWTIRNGSNALVLFNSSQPSFCAEDFSGEIPVDIENATSGLKTFSLTASSSQFAPIWSQTALTLDSTDTQTVDLKVNFDPNGNYGTTSTTTTSTSSDDRRNPSCNDIVPELHGISISKGSTDSYEFDIANNSDYDFDVSDFDLFDEESDVTVSEEETPSTIPAHGSQTFTVKVSATTGAVDKVANGKLKVGGTFSGERECTSSDIGTKTFKLFVGNVEQTPSCNDVQIYARDVRMNEDSTENVVFHIANSSQKTFTVSSIDLSSDSDVFNASTKSFDSSISQFNEGEINLEIKTFQLDSTLVGTGSLLVDGYFAGGVSCNNADASYDVQALVLGGGSTTTTSDGSTFFVPIFAESGSEKAVDEISFDVARCSIAQNNVFTLSVPTSCTKLSKNQTKDISYTLRNSTSGDQILSVNVNSDLHTSYHSSALVKAGSSKNLKVKVVPLLTDALGKHDIDITAYSGGKTLSQTACVELTATHALLVIPQVVEAELASSGQIQIPLQIVNADYSEQVSLSTSNLPNAMHATFDDSNFSMTPRSTQDHVLTLNSSGVTAGDYSISVQAKSDNASNSQNILVHVSGSAKTLEAIRIDSYPIRLKISPDSNQIVSVTISNNSGQKLDNIRVYFQNLPENASFKTLFVSSLEMGDSLQLRGELDTNHAIPGVYHAKLVAENNDVGSERDVEITVEAPQRGFFAGLFSGQFGNSILLGVGIIVLLLIALAVFSRFGRKTQPFEIPPVKNAWR